MSDNAQDDSSWTNAFSCTSNIRFLFREILFSDKLAISSDINNLLKHDIHQTVDAHADVAAKWTSTGCICISISAVSIWDCKFLRVPLSESHVIFVVFNLLGNDSSSTTLIVVELNSVLSNVWGHGVVVIC